MMIPKVLHARVPKIREVMNTHKQASRCMIQEVDAKILVAKISVKNY